MDDENSSIIVPLEDIVGIIDWASLDAETVVSALNEIVDYHCSETGTPKDVFNTINQYARELLSKWEHPASSEIDALFDDETEGVPPRAEPAVCEFLYEQQPDGAFERCTKMLQSMGPVVLDPLRVDLSFLRAMPIADLLIANDKEKVGCFLKEKGNYDLMFIAPYIALLRCNLTSYIEMLNNSSDGDEIETMRYLFAYMSEQNKKDLLELHQAEAANDVCKRGFLTEALGYCGEEGIALLKKYLDKLDELEIDSCFVFYGFTNAAISSGSDVLYTLKEYLEEWAGTEATDFDAMNRAYSCTRGDLNGRIKATGEVCLDPAVPVFVFASYDAEEEEISATFLGNKDLINKGIEENIFCHTSYTLEERERFLFASFEIDPCESDFIQDNLDGLNTLACSENVCIFVAMVKKELLADYIKDVQANPELFPREVSQESYYNKYHDERYCYFNSAEDGIDSEFSSIAYLQSF